MYTEVAWVLVSSGTQVQPQVVLDPDYLPDYLSVSYDYVPSDLRKIDLKIYLFFYEQHAFVVVVVVVCRIFVLGLTGVETLKYPRFHGNHDG